MTTLEALVIRGIRSYYPEDRAVIRFQKPLTLILGANGSGKTTIIECLRMATTGKLPPSSGHGSSFIHDSKLSGVPEVKGEIKLKFEDVSGKQIVITRHFQAANKKKGGATPTYNQLEANIQDKTSGRTATHKCSEVDSLIPLQMGVSPAVLEHVIFCHQEESNWVLGEPKMLKDRFDAIFASTRYSKALEAITKIQKDQRAEIKVLETEEKNLSGLKEMARTKKLNLEGKQQEKEDCNDVVKKAEKELKELKEIISKCEGVIQDTSDIESKKADYNKDLLNLKDRLEPLAKVLQDHDEYTEEDIPRINQMRNNMVARLETFSNDKKMAEEDVRHAERKVNKRIDKLDAARQLESDLKAENASFQKRKADWEKKAKEVSDKLELGFGEEQLKNESWQAIPSAFSRKVKELVDKKETEEREAKKKHSQERDQVQTKVAQLTMKTQTNEQRQLDVSSECRKLTDTLNNEKREISALQAKVASLADRKATMEQRQREIDTRQATFDEKTKRRELDELISKEAETKGRKRHLQDEQRAVNQAYDKRLIHESNVKAKADLEGDISDRIEVKERELRSALGGELPDTFELVEKLAEYARRTSERFEEMRKEHQRVNQGRAMVEHKRTHVKEQIKEQELVLERLEIETSDLKVNGGQIKQWEQEREKAGSRLDACAATIKRLQDKKANIEREAKQNKAFAELSDSFIKTAETKHICGLCYRGFDHEGGSSFEDFVAELKKQRRKLEDSPEKQEENKQAIATVDQSIAVIEQASRTFHKADDVRDQISRFQEQIAELDQELQGQPGGDQDAMDAEEEKMIEAQNLEKWAAGLRISELERLAKAVQDGAAEFGRDGGANGRKEELDRLLQDADAELEDVAKEKESKQEDISMFQGEIAKKKEELSAIKLQVDLLTVDSKKLEEYRGRATATEQNLNSLQKEVAELKERKLPDEEQLKACKANQTRLQAEHSSVEAKVAKEAKELSNSFQSVQNLETDIYQYVVQGKAKALSSKKDEKEQLEKDVEEARKEKEQKEADLKKMSGSTDEVEGKMRTLNDVLESITIKTKIEKIGGKIKELDAKLLNVPPEDEVRQTLRSYQGRKDKLTEEIHKAKGKMSSLSSIVKEYEKELGAAQFQNIEERHKMAQVKLVATKSSNLDLQRYYTALDKALMKFHEMKMEEINKIIRDYWQATYKGKDIETIEIKADVDTSATKRSHNYRLVMKHRTEAQLDMRGRCSAGQKVLAALVVRLALAESFCHNCGVLALDEPTSNLDHANIAGFTDALSRIVKERAKSGFQLIVISHDDDFIEKLAKDTEVEVYWRVSKDANAKSGIDCHKVTYLG
uniref:Endonuclease GajA/Old nuclease/RecF-like AAA domain-containing protein n=4 Tax=Hemiselmis andersenii TaxID=464988 RepID=A0A6U5A8W5_HEMAN|mmetsp:Transcript_47039/g.114337  ORF Transcript_47039/g.114337 Transcript_47039/m.114337 type:complete len:1333 (+) Transcript_47039:209-4207(+)